MVSQSLVGSQELVKTGAAMKTPLFFLDQSGRPSARREINHTDNWINWIMDDNGILMIDFFMAY
jgi:hypothetical protein